MYDPSGDQSALTSSVPLAGRVSLSTFDPRVHDEQLPDTSRSKTIRPCLPLGGMPPAIAVLIVAASARPYSGALPSLARGVAEQARRAEVDQG